MEIDDVLEEIKRRMLEEEEKAIDDLPNYPLEELIGLYNAANQHVFEDAQQIKNILKSDRKKYGIEGIFSTCRILHAILAEIEYRIRENKI